MNSFSVVRVVETTGRMNYSLLSRRTYETVREPLYDLEELCLSLDCLPVENAFDNLDNFERSVSTVIEMDILQGVEDKR